MVDLDQLGVQLRCLSIELAGFVYRTGQKRRAWWGGGMRGHVRSFRCGFAVPLTLQTIAVSTASTGQVADVNPTAAVLVDYGERLDRYLELREDAIDDVDDAEETRHPEHIRSSLTEDAPAPGAIPIEVNLAASSTALSDRT